MDDRSGAHTHAAYDKEVLWMIKVSFTTLSHKITSAAEHAAYHQEVLNLPTLTLPPGVFRVEDIFTLPNHI